MTIFLLFFFVFFFSFLLTFYFYRSFSSVSERENLQKEFLSLFKKNTGG